MIMDINQSNIHTHDQNNWDVDDMTRMQSPLKLHDHHHQLSYYHPLQTPHHLTSSSVQVPSSSFGNNSMEEQDHDHHHEPEEELGAMKEMMYKIAAMQPVDIDPETIQKPKRRNIRISDDPQSVAARHRRERISERIRILQRLVPGGTKMDTATMLDEAIRYVKFLKRQVYKLQSDQIIVSSSLGVKDNLGSSITPMEPHHLLRVGFSTFRGSEEEDEKSHQENEVIN